MDTELLPKHMTSHMMLNWLGETISYELQYSNPEWSLDCKFPSLFLFVNSFFQQFYSNEEDDREYSYEQAVLWVCDNFLSPIVKKVEFDDLTEAIMRAFTFDYLTLEYTNSFRDTKFRGLRHTCCTTLPMYPGQGDLDSYGEDHEEIRNEDHALLRKLDELVLEFMGRFSREACSFSDFISDHWFPRMEEVVHELENNNLVQPIEIN
ncbi:hypothetical protein K449DRAFT_469303 [Hypoxylon sp. EC38]|nr:hypothetical protein K449DRAFT_469303 [Hypoxylon sp. EC38]